MEIGKADFSAHNYQSPIELIEGRMRTEVEDKVILVVQEMGIKVDKDELLWALAYDRRQYEKGYAVGYAQREREIIRCRDCKHNPKESWFGCPMSHLSEAQRPDDAWCWKGERKEVEDG